jgi:hypothetical protein
MSEPFGLRGLRREPAELAEPFDPVDEIEERRERQVLTGCGLFALELEFAVEFILVCVVDLLECCGEPAPTFATSAELETTSDEREVCARALAGDWREESASADFGERDEEC